MDSKVCIKCKQVLALASFHRCKSRPDGVANRCRSCAKAYIDHYRLKRKEELNEAGRRYYHKNGHRLRRHGLDSATYEAMPKVCAICHSVGDGRWKTLNIDHDHLTGRVRGLLCMKCNKGLGLFRDDPTLLAKAIEYLRIQET